MNDLVVVGGGHAGLAAAAHAAERGLRVVVCEKTDRFGGSASLSAGILWTAPDVKTMREVVPDGDPELGRLLVDNSPCCDNYHLKTDIDDYHQYYSIPDNADRWDKWVADFATRPAWAFSSHGDAVRTKQEPMKPAPPVTNTVRDVTARPPRDPAGAADSGRVGGSG